MSIPNSTLQPMSNLFAALGNYVGLQTGAGGTTGANEATGGSYARQQSASPTPDGVGDNNFVQVNIPCAAGSYQEGSLWSVLSGSTLAVPSGASATGSGSGGTLAANTWYYVVTAFNHAGETTKSAEVSATTTGSTSSVAISWSHISGVYNLPTLAQYFAGYKIYRGTVSGSENVLVGTVAASATTWTDTGVVGTSATPPVSNTAATFIGSSAFDGGTVTVTGSGASINVAPSISVI